MANHKIYRELISCHLLDICTSLLFTFKILNYSLVSLMGSVGSGYLKPIFFIISLVSAILIAINLYIKLQNKETISISAYGLALVAIITLLYAASFSRSSLSPYEFLIYFCLSFILANRRSINISRILTSVMVISLIPLTCFSKLFYVKWFGGVDMDISYAFLPTIVAAIVHLAFFYKQTKNKKAYAALYLVNLMYLFQICLYGQRGTLFCIILAIALCWLLKRRTNGNFELRKFSLKLAILSIVSLIAVLFYKEILSFIANVANIDSYAINKFIQMSSTDVSNGRFGIYELALNGILKHPILGNGIATFQYNTGIIYIHNILLQLLYDGGLLLYIPFLYVFIRGTKTIFKSANKNLTPYWIYLFSTSMVYLLFSNDMWFVPGIWIFAGFLSTNMPTNKKIERRRHSERQ